MNLSRNLVASFDLDRLFHEVTRAALQNYGWRLLDPKHPVPCDGGAEIILVAGCGPVLAVIERLRRTRAELPNCKVVVLGANGSEVDLVRYITEGASACVLVSQGLADLVAVLEMIRDNRSPSTGRITQLVISAIHRLSENPAAVSEPALSLREEEVLRLIQDGLSNKEIANRLQITSNTVKNHVHHLLEKLNVRNRHEAAWLGPKPRGSDWDMARNGTGE